MSDSNNNNINKQMNSLNTKYDNNPLLSMNQTTIVPNNTPENSPPLLTNNNSSSCSTNKSNFFFTAHEGGNRNNNNNNNSNILIKGENQQIDNSAGNFIIEQPNDILNKQLQKQQQQQNNLHDNDSIIQNKLLNTKDLYMNLYPQINFETKKLKMSSWIQSKFDNDNDYSLNESQNNDGINKKTNSSDSNNNNNHNNSTFLKDNAKQTDTLLENVTNSSSEKKDTILLGSSTTGIITATSPKNLDETRSEVKSSDSNNLSHYHDQFVTSSIEQSRIPTGKEQFNSITNIPSSAPPASVSSNKSISETPNKPPKIINSKFDGMRTRLLNNPKIVPSSASSSSSSTSTSAAVATVAVARRHSDEEDMMGTAAAVLSNMRSSPFKFKVSKNSTSRPHSSSFSARGSNSHHSRPRLIVHKIKDMDPKDENAIGSLSSTEEESTDHEQNSPKGTVNWNKNGKRVSTTHIETTATTTTTTTKVKVLKNDSKYQPIASTKTLSYQQKKNINIPQHNDTNDNNNNDDDDENRMEPLSEETLKASITGAKNSFRVMSDGRIVKNGNRSTRSRSGCWICRLRKKKCTEEKPTCVNCSRLNLTCYYDVKKPDFVADPVKKAEKLKEIKKFTRAAKRSAMKKKTYIVSTVTESDNNSSSTLN
ncbi:hypothetical protein C6P45_002031 [Maudiozyma exigua]|uniref:Zn(2)-C6 fungal-type domain-containing protein n=1 Tax=Maudiozyma exigua TaxID=34358 RepID=A0A9P6WDI8_MAUEX|nr:hypothetical protein C6P45_002031 [Kazachstania exigua]